GDPAPESCCRSSRPATATSSGPACRGPSRPAARPAGACSSPAAWPPASRRRFRPPSPARSGPRPERRPPGKVRVPASGGWAGTRGSVSRRAERRHFRRADENGSFRPSAYAPAITMIQRGTPETSAGRDFPEPNACPDVAIPAFRAGARRPLCQRSAMRVSIRGKSFPPGELQGTDRRSAARSGGVVQRPRVRVEDPLADQGDLLTPRPEHEPAPHRLGDLAAAVPDDGVLDRLQRDPVALPHGVPAVQPRAGAREGGPALHGGAVAVLQLAHGPLLGLRDPRRDPDAVHLARRGRAVALVPLHERLR